MPAMNVDPPNAACNRRPSNSSAAQSIAFALLLFSACACSSSFHPSTTGKKLISYGQDWPNTAYLRAHIAEMETRPFDGIVIAASHETAPAMGGESMGNDAWGKTRYNFADYAHCIDDLKATRFKKFTD